MLILGRAVIGDGDRRLCSVTLEPVQTAAGLITWRLYVSAFQYSAVQPSAKTTCFITAVTECFCVS